MCVIFLFLWGLIIFFLFGVCGFSELVVMSRFGVCCPLSLLLISGAMLSPSQQNCTIQG